MKKLLFLLALFSFFNAQSQIVIDNAAPYGNPTFLIDNLLLGGGVTAANHSFQGASSQIGFFNAINTSLGIDSGIVMSTGDIYSLDPFFIPPFPGPIFPPVTDPDLLNVAQSVPGLIGQTFTVSSVNDIAILEFDFIPTSDTLQFRYAFGSEEYFAFENSAYNDVFGFFLSGPGITGAFASPAAFPNGSVNLAVVPNTAPPLPITISSICNDPFAFPFPAVMNPQYFVDNQLGLDTIATADGYTTVLTAFSPVQCGETYHIRLAIADGSDGSLDSYVWLEAGSFFSPTLSVVDDLGIDSVIMLIECIEEITLTADAGFGATYEWFDSTSVVFSTDSFVEVNAGFYVVAATIAGCTIFSDTLKVFSGASDSLPPTLLNCVAESDGAFFFDWEHPLGASVVTNYQIMASSNIGGPYFNISDVAYPLTTYSHDASLLPFGTQFFYITTASECVEALTSDTVSPIYFSISQTNVNCWDDTDGSIQVFVEDYINVLSYGFYLDGVLNPNSHPLDTFFNNVSAGSHLITVTDNSSSCLLDFPVTISSPGFPLQALASSSVVVCHGGSSGVVVGSSAGGTPGYIYSWYESGNPVSFSSNDTVDDLIDTF